MTELETVQRAKMYMDKLAQGVDPITDQEIPGDSVLNNVRLARCFFYVSDILGQVIANGGTVGGKTEFAITPDQLAGVELSPEPIPISHLVERINAAADNPRMKKLNATTVTNWLLGKGFLEKQPGADGKSRRVPSQDGFRIGLSAQLRQGLHGEYQAVYYNLDAQRFVLDNLDAILTEK